MIFLLSMWTRFSRKVIAGDLLTRINTHMTPQKRFNITYVTYGSIQIKPYFTRGVKPNIVNIQVALVKYIINLIQSTDNKNGFNTNLQRAALFSRHLQVEFYMQFFF